MIKENKMINYPMKSGENIQFPFYLIKGKEAGPTICITAGIHGCEFTSIMAAIRLYKILDPIKVKGQIKIIPIVNLPAFKNNTMFTCPIDNKNLNGTFPGSENGSYSEQLVFRLFLGLEKIITCLKVFRREFKNLIWLEIMLINGINDDLKHLQKLKTIIMEINPDKIQLNTVIRPPNEKFARPLNLKDLEKIRDFFGY